MAEDPQIQERRHARRVAAIVSGHRDWVRATQDTFGLANAIFNTEFWGWYDAWGNRKFPGKWRLKRCGEETEDNRIQREVQAYNAALFPNNMKVNVKPDPSGRGDPAVKSALASLWVDLSDQKMAILSGSELAVLQPGSAFKVAVEEGTGNPLERVYVEVVPPWELVVDRGRAHVPGRTVHRPHVPVPRVGRCRPVQGAVGEVGDPPPRRRQGGRTPRTQRRVGVDGPQGDVGTGRARLQR